jgi:hypothetical protein
MFYKCQSNVRVRGWVGRGGEGRGFVRVHGKDGNGFSATRSQPYIDYTYPGIIDIMNIA